MTRVSKPAKLKLTPPRPKMRLPDGPYLSGEHRELTPSGLLLIEAVAANGGGQAVIAAKLGMPAATFLKRCRTNDGDNEYRLAYERGKAALDYELATLLLEQARAGQILAQIYFSKARLGWTDTPQMQTNNGLTIVLPAAMDRESYLKSIQTLPQLEIIKEDANG